MDDRGLIGYADLTEWWDLELTHTDRAEIQEGYCPLGEDDAVLDQGIVISRTGIDNKPVTQLRVLTDLLNSSAPYEVKQKIISQGIKSAKKCRNALDLHFFYGMVISIEYRNRDDKEGALDRAIEACKLQISMAPKAKAKLVKSAFTPGFIPSHQGYKQLAIILEKQKKYNETISLCEQALSQGWQGDWEKRIERCNKKIMKST